MKKAPKAPTPFGSFFVVVLLYHIKTGSKKSNKNFNKNLVFLYQKLSRFWYGFEVRKNNFNNYAFLDSQNIYLSIKNQGWKIDWFRFRIYLKEHYEIKKAFIFIGYIEGNNELYSKLQEAGFICVFKPVLKNKDGSIKGNVDAELVLQTIHEINNFEKAVIVTGDGDFYCLIKYLKDRNKLKTVLVPDINKYSALIKRFAQKDIAFMNYLKERIEYKKRTL